MKMKKIRFIFLSTAIVLATAGAFATRTGRSSAKRQVLYHHVGDSYPGTFLPAGTLGVDYICQSSFDTCTYYLDGGTYYPYNLGTYTPLH